MMLFNYQFLHALFPIPGIPFSVSYSRTQDFSCKTQLTNIAFRLVFPDLQTEGRANSYKLGTGVSQGRWLQLSVAVRLPWMVPRCSGRSVVSSAEGYD